MEIFLLILLGVVISLIISSFRGEAKKNMRIINKNVKHVLKEVGELKEKVDRLENQNNKPPQKFSPVHKEPKPLKVEGQRLPVNKPAAEEKPKVIQPKVNKPSVKPVEPKSTINEKKDAVQPKEQKQPIQKAITTEGREKVIETTKINQTTTPKEKRDYEKLIGENWLNKIGIAILVIGIGFFVKYAIDQNWIGEVGRVGIGIAIGGILMGIAHYLRKKYRAFSSVLIGGGISILYYTISIAYHDYGLLSQKTAFIVMLTITFLSTILAIIYDRKELAIIALIGAFTSPFMVRGETSDPVTFFTYIAIINTGMLILSYFKKWSIITRLALFFTVLFFGGWVIISTAFGDIMKQEAMVFASIFFIQFLGMNLIYNLVKKIKFSAWEFIQLTGITALYYGCMMFVIGRTYSYNAYGTYTLVMASLFIGLATTTHLLKGTDKALKHLLFGKAITFVTLTGALVFESNYMTLFWAVEAVILLAIGQRSKMKILNSASAILTLITAIGLLRDWTLFYSFNQSLDHPIFNKTFVTGLFATGTFIVTYVLLKRSNSDRQLHPMANYDHTIGGLALISGYLTILLELILQLEKLNTPHGSQLILWIFHLALLVGGLFIAKRRKSELLQLVFFFIACFAIVGYLIIGQYNNAIIRDRVLLSGLNDLYYFMHFMAVTIVIGVLFLLRNNAKSIFNNNQKQINWFMSAISIAGLVMATAELNQILTYAFSAKYGMIKVLSHTQTEGYTVLWGLYSFVVMIRGMHKKNRVMRILALAMFSMTLLKLFIVDIREISEAGKIIAFISLGVLLLVVSFMYQKLKQIIVGE